jgi:hypothetical protein
VQVDNFIQLERCGLHNINSHVAHTIDDDEDQHQDLIDNADDYDGFDDDVDSENENDSDYEDDCKNSSEIFSYGIQSIFCFITLSEIVSTILLFYPSVVTVPHTNKPPSIPAAANEQPNDQSKFLTQSSFA